MAVGTLRELAAEISEGVRYRRLARIGEDAGTSHVQFDDLPAEDQQTYLDCAEAALEVLHISSCGTLMALQYGRDIVGDEIGEPAAAEKYLPPRFKFGPAVLDKLAREVTEVYDRILNHTLLKSTAQEVVAHAIIDQAMYIVNEGYDDGRFEAVFKDGEFPVEDLPRVRSELWDLKEDAFEDHDVLLLWEGKFDGIEDSAVAEQAGMANLHPDDWFKPFRETPAA